MSTMIHATILTMTMSAVTCALLVVCVVVLVAKASHYSTVYMMS